MARHLLTGLLASGALLCIPLPSSAQQLKEASSSPPETHSHLVWQSRAMADPGTFWLDNQDDREIIRYTTPRDVRLCSPEPQGLGAADHGYPLTVTWDQTNVVTLYPGNCLYFDAKRVSVKPATRLPSGVTLRGHVDVAS